MAETAQQWGQDRPVTIDSNGGLQTPDGTVRPNTGASVKDVQAAGDQRETLSTWREKNGIDVTRQIKLVKLSHMRYQHTELDSISKFMVDFGMHIAKRTEREVWFRGYGPDPYVYYACLGDEKKFLGGTFEVEQYSDLEKAAQVPGAGSIKELTDAPGGGHILTLVDPEGFLVNLMHGQEPAPRGDLPQKLVYNDESDKPRVRRFNRFTPGPAAIHKLGHFGLCVQQFQQQVQWYSTHFNLVPTDFLYVPLSADGAEKSGKKDVAVFMHVDRGADPVDHHTFFMSTNKTSHVHHCSFEVHDYDTQHLGHQWLAKQGYTSVWGIGRHILGSQIFDYWWETSGNMIEHYADGDLVNEETPVSWGLAGDESLAVWGPEVPKWFLD